MAIYLDNAATSFPKPEVVYQAVNHYMRNVGASSGRGAYRQALYADQLVFETRFRLAQLFNIDDASRIVFTANATEALNLAIKGYVNQGDHVIASGMEHNASWRTLKTLASAGIISLSTMPHDSHGTLQVQGIARLFQPHTRLMVMPHVSNVTGGIMPVGQVAQMCQQRGVAILLDTAQSAGIIPINVKELGIDMLAFTGHKGLLGPQGTGGLYLQEGMDLRPLKEGGTGSESALEYQPALLPDRYEAGTLNVAGIVGLGAALEFITREGLEKIEAHERHLTTYVREELAKLPGLTMYGPSQLDQHIGVVSFQLAGWPSEEIAAKLDAEHDIMVRAGLHCAPSAHRVLGTLSTGAVRVGLGYFNTREDVDQLLNGLLRILKL